MAETKNELKYLFSTESLRHVPFAILGNKIDIPTACSGDELRHYLDLPQAYNSYGGGEGGVTTRPNGGPVQVFMVGLFFQMISSNSQRY